MIECKSIEEARKVNGVCHIELGNPVKAWQRGDVLPRHLIVDPTAEGPNEIEQLKARVAELEAALTRSR